MVIRPETTKGEFNVVFAFRIYAGQVCQLGHISASCRKTDGNPAFVPVCPFTLCSLVAARWEAGVIPLFCLMYCCFPDWNPNLKFAACKTEGFAKSLKLCNNTTQWFLNRPNIQKLREIDEKFYATWLTKIPLHSITLLVQCITLHCNIIQHNTIQNKTIQYITLHYMSLHTLSNTCIYIYTYNNLLADRIIQN